MLEISILHDPIMEFIVFLTVLISSLTEEELCNFFHFSILTENVYWKLLKYKLTMLILTRNMQIFIELWYESLICVTRVAMRTNCYWKPDPIIFLFFFKALTGDQLLFRLSILLYWLSVEKFLHGFDFVSQFSRHLIFQNLSSSENFNPYQYCWFVVYLL